MSKETKVKRYIPNVMKIRWAKFWSHILILFLIFIAPELLFNIGENPPLGIYTGPIICVIVFYLNYYLLVDKLLFKKNRRCQFALVNIIILVVSILIINYIRLQEAPPLPPPFYNHHVHNPLFNWLKMTPRLVPIIMAILLSIALKFGEKWYSWSLLEQQMKSDLKENELKNLKNQLNPHFLFNTLNNIYALIAISQDKAQLAVHNLSQLLRYILYNNENEVPLSKELQFIQNYIDLMKLRISSIVTLNVNIDKDVDQSVTIAPLMFISLVENAFKHGISSKSPSTIDIQIHYDGKQVNCHVQNSLFPKDKEDKSGSGIGIINLKKQLDIIYPNNYTFNIKTDNQYYTVDLMITLSHNNI